MGVIPARFLSSRFQGKPLAMIAGRTMIERVYRRAAQATALDELLVATDDERIARCVESFGGKVVMTGADCPTGMDRVAEVARDRSGFDAVVNIQGDEPLLEPYCIDRAVGLVKRTPEAHITTIVRPARTLAEIEDPNCVKAVLGGSGRVHYFSRSLIPYCKVPPTERELVEGTGPYMIHIGLYVYRREVLLSLTGLAQSSLEVCESLEQLRALDAGFTVYAAVVEESVSIGVDAPEDIPRVERKIKELGLE